MKKNKIKLRIKQDRATVVTACKTENPIINQIYIQAMYIHTEK